MKLSGSETNLGLAALAVALLGGTYLAARPRIEEWKQLRADQVELRRQIDLDRRLVADRPRWEAELAQLSKLLPAFPANQKMDAHWLSEMDRIAALHGITITQRGTGDEKRAGDVFELPVEARVWEGSLEALVNFLYALQSQGAMMDVRQIQVRPKPKGNGLLSGRMTLYCAYTRQETAK